MAEMIYSNVTFTPHPNRDAGLRSNVNEAMEHEEDVTYSEVRTGAGQQANAQKESNPSSGNPSAKVGSKVVTTEKESARVTFVSLVCLCVILLVLSITLGVLYAEEARSRAAVAQMMENLTVRKELLSSELQHCEKNLTEFSNNLTAIKAIRCASGWEFYNGSCYHFSEDILNWEQSQYACIREGGHLVIIESQQEQNFIRLKVGNMNDQNNYWIGMTDMKEEGVWVWMDNTPLNKSIKYWDLNNGTGVSDFPEPNDWESNEDCAQMGQRCFGQISCWLDNQCNLASKRICESRAVRS